jgi:hypothetical protein
MRVHDHFVSNYFNIDFLLSRTFEFVESYPLHHYLYLLPFYFDFFVNDLW